MTTTKRPGHLPTPIEIVTGLALAAAIFYFIFYDSGKAYGAEFYSLQHTGRGSYFITAGEIPAGSIARVIEVPANDDPATTERWTAYCQPVESIDRFGVVRLSYAKPGCEFGRDHD